MSWSNPTKSGRTMIFPPRSGTAYDMPIVPFAQKRNGKKSTVRSRNFGNNFIQYSMTELFMIMMLTCYIGGIYVGKNWEQFTKE